MLDTQGIDVQESSDLENDVCDEGTVNTKSHTQP